MGVHGALLKLVCKITLVLAVIAERDALENRRRWMQSGQKSSREKQAAFCKKYCVYRQAQARFRTLTRTHVGMELIYWVLHERSSPGDPEVRGRGGSSAPSSCFLASFCTARLSFSQISWLQSLLAAHGTFLAVPENFNCSSKGEL